MPNHDIAPWFRAASKAARPAATPGANASVASLSTRVIHAGGRTRVRGRALGMLFVLLVGILAPATQSGLVAPVDASTPTNTTSGV